MVLKKKTFNKFSQCIFTTLLLSPFGKWCELSFDQNWIDVCYCPSGSGWENFKIWSLTISLLSPLGNDIHVYLHIRSDRNFIWNSLENYILCKIHEIFPNEFHFYSVSLKFLKWISHAEILSVCVIFCRIYHTGSSYNQNLYAVYIINI